MEGLMENYMLVRFVMVCVTVGSAYALIALYGKCAECIHHFRKEKNERKSVHYRHAHSM